MTSEQLVKALQEAMGPNLKSIVLYGSAAAGDFMPGVSGHDILIIAERLGAAELSALATPSFARLRAPWSRSAARLNADDLAGAECSGQI